MSFLGIRLGKCNMYRRKYIQQKLLGINNVLKSQQPEDKTYRPTFININTLTRELKTFWKRI